MRGAGLENEAMTGTVARVLHRWPTTGLTVAVVRPGAPVWFHQHGVVDVGTGLPTGPDTVFRVASITKTFTAVAVMQLWEKGLVDLDAPVAEYLRAYALVPARKGFRPATLRHLLTHTSGVRAVRGPSDLLRPAMGWGTPSRGPVPSLAEYYRRGLRVDVEPGTRWAYSNHGFATLGQVVADVTGRPFDSYLREEVLDPLGMESSDLVRSERVRPRLATGYRLRGAGPAEVADLEVVTAGGGALYSTARDMSRYLTALLGGGTNEHGTVLRGETLALMFEPHHQPDPRVPGMGLGFFRGDVEGRRTVGHDGIWLGFLSDMVLAPDEGVGVVALASTGSFEPRGAPVPVADGLLRLVVGARPPDVSVDVPQRPGDWGDVCGSYSFGPGFWTDPQPRTLLGPGVEVAVRRGRLVLRGRTPIPAVRRGLPLLPSGDDPDAFLMDASALGIGTTPVVFGRGPDGGVTALHLGLMPMSFMRSDRRETSTARRVRGSARRRQSP